MQSDELDFELPPHLIAQAPAPDRSHSRLLHYTRRGGAIEHRVFSDLPSLLRPGDLLVFNNARVLPARISLRKRTGGKVEGLFLGERSPGEWNVLLKNLGRPVQATLGFADDPAVTLDVLDQQPDGSYRARIDPPQAAAELLGRLGRMPLPPYIHRQRERDELDAMDRERYQTVFAAVPGAVAAPTAALHFTPGLLQELQDRGVDKTFVTLDVGLGTFKPLSSQTLEQHDMHAETYQITPAAADSLNRARRDGRRIIAVGTTSARVLESQPAEADFTPHAGQTRLFIYPPYRWKRVDALVTNFHLPRSTLIALVAAMIGLETQRRLYRIAIENSYRFFSYGDAMLIE